MAAVGQHRQVDERAPARAESVAPLRRAVIEFATAYGATKRQREDIAVAVSEALTNAVQHGYRDSDDAGVVVARAWIQDGLLQVVVCDEGVGMRPRFTGRGTGFGLLLIGRFAQQMRFEDAMPGTRLRMTFALG